MAPIDVLMKHWGDHFEFHDKELVEMCISTIASTSIVSNPIWMFLVGASGGLKTTVLKSFDDLYRSSDGLYPEMIIKMDMATSAVFASAKNRDPDLDLLSKLDKKCLIIKDFTSILQKNAWERDAIFGELRAIYDGSFNKHSGNIGEKVYEGYRFSILAAVTGAIEEFYSVGQILGERFLKIKIDMDDRLAMKKALENVGKEDDYMTEISEITARIVTTTQMELKDYGDFSSEGFEQVLYRGAELVAKGRTAIRRKKNGEMRYTPDTEKPTRIIKQLRQLLACCAVIERRPEIEIAERIVKRISYDSMPAGRARILEALESVQEGTVAEVQQASRLSTHAVRWGLEDLTYLDLIKKRKQTGKNGYIYESKDLWIEEEEEER
jgi:hypothetical protein